MPGSTIAIAPSLLQQVSDFNYTDPVPNAPVAG